MEGEAIVFVAIGVTLAAAGIFVAICYYVFDNRPVTRGFLPGQNFGQTPEP